MVDAPSRFEHDLVVHIVAPGDPGGQVRVVSAVEVAVAQAGYHLHPADAPRVLQIGGFVGGDGADLRAGGVSHALHVGGIVAGDLRPDLCGMGGGDIVVEVGLEGEVHQAVVAVEAESPALVAALRLVPSHVKVRNVTAGAKLHVSNEIVGVDARPPEPANLVAPVHQLLALGFPEGRQVEVEAVVAEVAAEGDAVGRRGLQIDLEVGVVEPVVLVEVAGGLRPVELPPAEPAAQPCHTAAHAARAAWAACAASCRGKGTRAGGEHVVHDVAEQRGVEEFLVGGPAGHHPASIAGQRAFHGEAGADEIDRCPGIEALAVAV